ncbi:glycoside hydrolase superfamily [Talaromyces proteolyticus]|uniref:Beta-mannosidase B n=1 Tax=Talaromyces proteolyticus TaxID=1131652 RepID=A0AAD4KMD5_9EURO|nr:glycoside hydrolase superfamily [Talaromyces proteolyticus]KAH8696013.1 glycoside hydrolase superfamily [Talaromyces proteolyticus]
MAPVTEIRYLSSGWRFKRSDENDSSWAPVASVPTVVHLDLMRNGRIDDPFLDMKEVDVEWVGEHAWTYSTTFPTPHLLEGSKCYLIFEGLDTFAVVTLNGATILESDNMFLSHRVDISTAVKLHGENILTMNFDSALLRGRSIEKENPEYRFIAHNGETGRLGVRKAQYHWGWDWGPVLMTCGPWRPVRLEISQAYVEQLRIDYDLDESLSSLKGKVNAVINGQIDGVNLVLSIGGEGVFRKSSSIDSSDAVVEFKLDQPGLWYPHGYGEQNLYDVSLELVKEGTIIHREQRRVGFRKVELVRDDDQYGQSFYFKINNVDIFCGGSCWIPADNFLPRLTPEKYRKWLQTMIEGNQIMTRVWGGGIYEDDAFYDSCDELGILVWQDFMFGCGSYPTWPDLLDSIRREATQNIRRLRHHASIAIYAGNNEDYQIQEKYCLDYDYQNKDTDSWLRGTFPARFIYEHLLPTLCNEEHPSVPYWPSSPFSNGKHTSDLTCGDVHQWNVWHGTQEKYQKFPDIGGRFNSEFGLACHPNLQTIKHFVTETSEMFPQSRTLDFHNKADGHERRIATYIVENFRLESSLEGYIYLTQLAQAEALAFAYRGWRRQWGEKRRCGGALVWQINDCWPSSSWAIVDYFYRKKPGFYAVKRALEPLTVSVQREHTDWSVCHARAPKSSSYKVWVANSKTVDVISDVELRFISIESGQDIKEPLIRKNCSITANGTTDILDGIISNAEEPPHVLAARLIQNGTVTSRDVDWPQPFKYFSFKDRAVQIEARNDSFLVSASKPTKCLVIEEQDDITLSDNGIDLVPGETQIIRATGSGKLAANPRYRYLGFE